MMTDEGTSGQPWEGHPGGPFAGLHAWFSSEIARLEAMVRPAGVDPHLAELADKPAVVEQPAEPAATEMVTSNTVDGVPTGLVVPVEQSEPAAADVASEGETHD